MFKRSILVFLLTLPHCKKYTLESTTQTAADNFAALAGDMHNYLQAFQNHSQENEYDAAIINTFGALTPKDLETLLRSDAMRKYRQNLDATIALNPIFTQNKSPSLELATTTLGPWEIFGAVMGPLSGMVFLYIAADKMLKEPSPSTPVKIATPVPAANSSAASQTTAPTPTPASPAATDSVPRAQAVAFEEALLALDVTPSDLWDASLQASERQLPLPPATPHVLTVSATPAADPRPSWDPWVSTPPTDERFTQRAQFLRLEGEVLMRWAKKQLKGQPISSSQKLTFIFNQAQAVSTLANLCLTHKTPAAMETAVGAEKSLWNGVERVLGRAPGREIYQYLVNLMDGGGQPHALAEQLTKELGPSWVFDGSFRRKIGLPERADRLLPQTLLGLKTEEMLTRKPLRSRIFPKSETPPVSPEPLRVSARLASDSAASLDPNKLSDFGQRLHRMILTQ